MGAANELTFALNLRAFIEHAAAIEFIRSQIAGQRDRIRNTIWPSFASRIFPEVTLKDRAIHAELLRFAVGRQVDPLDMEMPDQLGHPSRWGKFYDEWYRQRAELPPQYQPKDVKDYIDPLRAVPGRRHFRVVYNRLCEYCHPNAASRLFDFHFERTDVGRHRIVNASDMAVSIGFQELFEMARRVVPAACEMLVGSMEEFSKCWMPIPSLNRDEAADQPPPIGSIAVDDDHGRRINVRLDRIVNRSDTQRMPPLTKEQENRVRKLYAALKEFDSANLEQWLDQFRSDGVYAEDDIRIYERILVVFRQEIADRNVTSLDERRQIYAAILQSTLSSSAADLVSQMPSVKSLPNFERLFARANDRSPANLDEA